MTDTVSHVEKLAVESSNTGTSHPSAADEKKKKIDDDDDVRSY